MRNPRQDTRDLSTSKQQQGPFTPHLHKLIQQSANTKNRCFFLQNLELGACATCHTGLVSLSKHPPASLWAPGSLQAGTLTLFFVEHLMPVRCVKTKLCFFNFQGGSEFTYLPKQRSANKASCIQRKVSANIWGFFQLKRGKTAFPQPLPTPPRANQTQKPSV